MNVWADSVELRGPASRGSRGLARPTWDHAGTLVLRGLPGLGFTLIELLVVIALLAAMLRPAEGPFVGQSVPRVRSFAINLWVGGLDGWTDGGFSGPGWRVYATTSDLVNPGAAQIIVFLDQREDRINWGNCLIDMTGCPDPAKTQF